MASQYPTKLDSGPPPTGLSIFSCITALHSLKTLPLPQSHLHTNTTCNFLLVCFSSFSAFRVQLKCPVLQEAYHDPSPTDIAPFSSPLTALAARTSPWPIAHDVCSIRSSLGIYCYLFTVQGSCFIILAWEQTDSLCLW